MAVNASIITDTAKEITQRTVVDYGAGVFAHTTQDWSKHNHVKVHASNPFVSPGGETLATGSLRIVATVDDGSVNGIDLAVALPINLTGTSAITSAAPIIVQQPISRVAPPTSMVQLSVAAISDIAITYQWQKEISSVWTNITGKTASTLVLMEVTTEDDGSYRVIATNANGSTTSSSATVSVVEGASGSEGDSFFEQLPQVRLAKRIFGLF